MHTIRQTIRWSILGLITVSAAGCGYSSQSLYPEGIKTVYVEMFQSKEFRRGLEMQLSEALVKEIARSTPYRNAPREKADTILTGEILEVRSATLGKDFMTDLSREQAITMVVSYRWKDMRTGKMLVQKEQFTQTAEYVPPARQDFYQGSENVVNKLARRMVESLETAW